MSHSLRIDPVSSPSKNHQFTNRPGVSIIIPAFNEQNGINGVLTQLHHTMMNFGETYEIIVVDDGSVDETAAQVDPKKNRLLRHSTNRGYGAALKTGIRHAAYNIIAMTDADGTYPNDCIPDLLQILRQGECDMVVAARTGEQVFIPWLRRPAKWAITRLAEFVAGQSIPDLNSGLRLYRRTTVFQFLDLLPNGFSFTTTITLAMLSNGYLVRYEPINYHPRIGRSKIRPIADTLNFIGLILRIALYFAPLKIFLPLGILLLMVGIFWGLYTKFAFGQLADVSTMMIIMSAFQISALGLLAELINKRLPAPLKTLEQLPFHKEDYD
ncbi:MAG: glycosyltransferase family 2 protein [Anaerolineae bacterium]|nr:glycosyltransferase family 2 protein [Anaerolineae bacterium]